MPQFQCGDIWSVYEQADLFLVTTNATLKGNGALVMGRGLARQARDRFPGIDLAFGQAIAARCGHLGRYHLLVSPHWPRAKLGAFQVKQDYRHQADLRLIREGVAALSGWCTAHPEAQVALNFPGIGHGHLSRSAVLPIIAQLPDQVTIWEYPPDVAPAAAPPAVAPGAAAQPHRFLPAAADLTAMAESRERFFALPEDRSLLPAARDRQIFADRQISADRQVSADRQISAGTYLRGAAWMARRAAEGSAAKEAACTTSMP